MGKPVPLGLFNYSQQGIQDLIEAGWRYHLDNKLGQRSVVQRLDTLEEGDVMNLATAVHFHGGVLIVDGHRVFEGFYGNIPGPPLRRRLYYRTKYLLRQGKYHLRQMFGRRIRRTWRTLSGRG